MLRKLQKKDLKKLQNFLECIRNKTIESYPSHVFAEQYILKSIIKNIQAGQALGNFDKKTGLLKGFAAWDNLQWDSQMLGLKVAGISNLLIRNKSAGQLIVARILEENRKRKVEYLTAKIKASDLITLHILQNFGFQITGILVKMAISKNAMIQKEFIDGGNIRTFKSGDLPILKQIASKSFFYDRFHCDSAISKKKSDQLHAMWVENDCRDRADKIFVAEKNNKQIGFITLSISHLRSNNFCEAIGNIGLVAVSRNARGENIGKNLVKKSIKWFSNRVDAVTVGTQINNYPAMLLYQSLGFRISSAEISLRILL